MLNAFIEEQKDFKRPSTEDQISQAYNYMPNDEELINKYSMDRKDNKMTGDDLLVIKHFIKKTMDLAVICYERQKIISICQDYLELIQKTEYSEDLKEEL